MSHKCCHYNPYHPRPEVLLSRTNKRAVTKGYKSVASLIANLAPPRWLKEPEVTVLNGRNPITSLDISSHNLRIRFSSHMEFAIDTFN